SLYGGISATGDASVPPLGRIVPPGIRYNQVTMETSVFGSRFWHGWYDCDCRNIDAVRARTPKLFSLPTISYQPSPPVAGRHPTGTGRDLSMKGNTRRCSMKALAISIVAGAALCGALAVPASAMPVSNLTAAVSELAVGQSVRYVRNHYRDRDSSSG